MNTTYTVQYCEEFKGQLSKLTERINDDKHHITDLEKPILTKAGLVGHMSKQYTLNENDDEDKKLIDLMNELTIKYKDDVVVKLNGGSKKKSHRKTRRKR